MRRQKWEAAVDQCVQHLSPAVAAVTHSQKHAILLFCCNLHRSSQGSGAGGKDGGYCNDKTGWLPAIRFLSFLAFWCLVVVSIYSLLAGDLSPENSEVGKGEETREKPCRLADCDASPHPLRLGRDTPELNVKKLMARCLLLRNSVLSQRGFLSTVVLV